MYITKTELETIEKALEILPTGELFRALSDDEKEIIVNADTIMVALYRRRKYDNERQKQAMREHRKIDKNYGRKRRL